MLVQGLTGAAEHRDGLTRHAVLGREAACCPWFHSRPVALLHLRGRVFRVSSPRRQFVCHPTSATHAVFSEIYKSSAPHDRAYSTGVAVRCKCDEALTALWTARPRASYHLTPRPERQRPRPAYHQVSARGSCLVSESNSNISPSWRDAPTHLPVPESVVSAPHVLPGQNRVGPLQGR